MFTPEEAETIAAHATEAGHPVNAAGVLAAARASYPSWNWDKPPPLHLPQIQQRTATVLGLVLDWKRDSAPCYALASTDPGRP